MSEAIFYRGGVEQFREIVPDPPPPDYRRRYREPFSMSRQFDIADMSKQMMNVLELYALDTSFKCPNCKCLVYNSQNYMELPVWVFEGEEHKRQNEERRKRFDAELLRLMAGMGAPSTR